MSVVSARKLGSFPCSVARQWSSCRLGRRLAVPSQCHLQEGGNRWLSWEGALKEVPPSALNSPLGDYAFPLSCPPVQLNSLCGCYVQVSPISWNPNTAPHSPPRLPSAPGPLGKPVDSTPHQICSLGGAGCGTWCCWGQSLLVSGLLFLLGMAPRDQAAAQPPPLPGASGQVLSCHHSLLRNTQC